MIETVTLMPGITLRCHRDNRFKQGALSIQMVRPMKEEEAAMNALLPAVWLRGTQKHPNLQAITQRLDDLYGASVGTMVRRIGDYQTTGLYCSFIEDRFALAGDEILAPMMDFLEQVLFYPVLEDGGLCKAFVEGEKKNLISTIEAEKNDKRAYAAARLLRLMCRKDSFGIPRLGTVEQVKKVDARALYAHQQRILKESPIAVFYVGSAPKERVADLVKKLLGKIERKDMPIPQQTPFYDGGGESHTQRMQVAQSQLCMGFVTPITNRSKDFAAMQVLNMVLGGGMTSKLFIQVREKMSLCYSISSGYYGAKGIVTVHAGIDAGKRDVAQQEIIRQLTLCQDGGISQEELTAAKEALQNSLRGIHDSPNTIEGFYSTAALSGLGMTPQEYFRAVEGVTLDDVVAAAKTLKLHTTYFLEGVGV